MGRGPGIGDRLELLPYVPRRRSLELQRDSEALLLLIPEADGRGKGVLSGKVFEYLAAERPILALVPPDGAAARLLEETGAGIVVAPDDVDGIVRELTALRDRWQAGSLDASPLSDEWRRSCLGARASRSSPISCKGSHETPRRRQGAVSTRRVTSFFFLATLFACTFEKVHWNVAGSVGIADVLALLFLIAFAATSRPRVPATSAVLLGFLAAFCVVYLAGFFNLETSDALGQFAKGFVKFVIHFAFLAAGVAWLWRRGQRYYWRALAWFCGGIAINALYGVAQLVVARGGGNLDASLLSPLTGGASQINVYGAVEGAKVYRPNALTGDPNHLGIMLIVPLLVLTPIYLRLERGHRYRRQLAALIVFLLLVEFATLSRSGILGLAVGALVLAVPYSRYLHSRALLYPLAGAVAVLVGIFLTQRHFFSVVLRSRIDTSGRVGVGALPGLRLHPADPALAPDVRARAEQLLGLLPVRDRQDELGPTLVLRVADRRDRARRDGPLRAVPDLGFRASPPGPGARALARHRRRPARGAGAAARVGLHGGARRDAGRERLLPDDAVLLLLRVPRARARGACGLRNRPERETARSRHRFCCAQQRHEPVVDREPEPWEVFTAEDPRLQQPSKGADRVDVSQLFSGEARLAELGRELGPCVAALVAEGAVERPEERRVRRHEEEQCAPRGKELAEARYRLFVVGDVLEDVEAHDRIEKPFDSVGVPFHNGEAWTLLP